MEYETIVFPFLFSRLLRPTFWGEREKAPWSKEQSRRVTVVEVGLHRRDEREKSIISRGLAVLHKRPPLSSAVVPFLSEFTRMEKGGGRSDGGNEKNGTRGTSFASNRMGVVKEGDA